MRNARLLRRLPNPARDFIHDHVIVRGTAAQQAPETNNRVILLSLRELPRRQRYLKRPRHAHYSDIFFLSAGSHQPIDRAQQKSLGDKCVESRNHDSKAHTHSAQRTFERGNPMLGRSLDNEILLVLLLRDSVPPWWVCSFYPVFLCDLCGKALDVTYP
jgi:hypothetical protein